jgi:spore germination protein GerM
MKEKRRIVLAVCLVLVAVVVSYLWLSSERERQLAVQDVGSEPLDVETTVLEDQSLGEIDVKLYSYNAGAVSPGSEFLYSRTGTIYETEDDVLKARQIVNELLKGIGKQQDGREAETRSYLDRSRLRNLYILEDGTAVVDLSSELINSIAGGITSELALIESVTRSLRANVIPVKRVRFLVDGKARETLAGHISIAHPFR